MAAAEMAAAKSDNINNKNLNLKKVLLFFLPFLGKTGIFFWNSVFLGKISSIWNGGKIPPLRHPINILAVIFQFELDQKAPIFQGRGNSINNKLFNKTSHIC